MLFRVFLLPKSNAGLTLVPKSNSRFFIGLSSVRRWREQMGISTISFLVISDISKVSLLLPHRRVIHPLFKAVKARIVNTFIMQHNKVIISVNLIHHIWNSRLLRGQSNSQGSWTGPWGFSCCVKVRWRWHLFQSHRAASSWVCRVWGVEGSRWECNP